MTSSPLTKIVALALAAVLSAAWLDTVVVGMQSPVEPVMHSIELPTVVIVARKATEPTTGPTGATAQVKPVAAKNS